MSAQNAAVEAWHKKAMDLVTLIDELGSRYQMYQTKELHEAFWARKAELDAHLRTTPEGWQLVPVELPDACVEERMKGIVLQAYVGSDVDARNRIRNNWKKQLDEIAAALSASAQEVGK